MKMNSAVLKNRWADKHGEANRSILATFHCKCAKNGSCYIFVLEGNMGG
jgi:hypothetical protein